MICSISCSIKSGGVDVDVDVEEETSKVAAVRRRRWLPWIWNAGEGGDACSCVMVMEEDRTLATAVLHWMRAAARDCFFPMTKMP